MLDLTPSRIYDIKKYCLELLGLKSEFHPITICLHHEDMFQKETYTKFGFKVVTIGNNFDPMFYKYFYNILENINMPVQM